MRSSSVRGLVAAGLAAAFVAGAWLLAIALPVLAASPAPTSEVGGDPPSSGQGPGLVGDPLLAIGIVVAIGLVVLVATLLYVRATGGPRQA
jgi:hypothetical protein